MLAVTSFSMKVTLHSRLARRAAQSARAAFLIANMAMATENTNSPAPASAAGATNTNQVVHLPDVVVTGRQDSLLGIADSASQGTTGAAQLAERPILRSGEILETVPGVIITQHAGGGKANQYFLRGFNLDHGTDFAVFLDDMPLNLPSHAHGEGYADMNAVIPEFVQRVDYEKGPYDAAVGNYGSAGSAHLEFYQTLPQDFVTLEGGMFGFERGVFGVSQTNRRGPYSLRRRGVSRRWPVEQPGRLLEVQRHPDLQPGRRVERFQRHGARLSWPVEFQRPNPGQLRRDESFRRGQSD